MRGKLASQRRSFLSKPRSSQVSLEKGTYKPSQGPGGTERGADALQTDSVPRLTGKERGKVGTLASYLSLLLCFVALLPLGVPSATTRGQKATLVLIPGYPAG